MKIHIVQKGDTLWKIAQKYNVNFEELKSANSQLSNPDMIMPGMKIKVPTASVPVKKETPIIQGVTKETPITKEMPIKKEMPIAKEMPITKEMPKKPEVMGVQKEAPKKPYVPKMPDIKPYFPEIDVNNYYFNVPITQQAAQINVPQAPPAPILPMESEESPEYYESPEAVKPMKMPLKQPEVKGVQTPMYPQAQAPFYPQYCVPASPVLPGSGLHGGYPQAVASAHGMGGMPTAPTHGYPMGGMPTQGYPTGVAPAETGMPGYYESDDFGTFDFQEGMYGPQDLEGDQTAVAGVQDVAGMQFTPEMAQMAQQMMPGMMNPQGMPGMIAPQGMPYGGMGAPYGGVPAPMPYGGYPMGGYPCVPVSPVMPGTGLAPMHGGFPQGFPQAGMPMMPYGPEAVAGAATNPYDCGCGGPTPQPTPYQMPMGMPGMHGQYGYGYYNAPQQERAEEDFNGPEVTEDEKL